LQAAGGGGGSGERPGDGPAHRLAHVAEKFSQFYDDLEHEKASRREAEAGRRNALYDQVQKLELDLETEAGGGGGRLNGRRTLATRVHHTKVRISHSVVVVVVFLTHPPPLNAPPGVQPRQILHCNLDGNLHCADLR
jgi:hypothetical protein